MCIVNDALINWGGFVAIGKWMSITVVRWLSWWLRKLRVGFTISYKYDKILKNKNKINCSGFLSQTYSLNSKLPLENKILKNKKFLLSEWGFFFFFGFWCWRSTSKKLFFIMPKNHTGEGSTLSTSFVISNMLLMK